jgi:hypothetical protein
MTAAMSISVSDVLHRDKVSWFCHIEAPTLRFVVNGFGGQWLGAAATADETSGSDCKMSGWKIRCLKLPSAKWGLPDACR